MDQPVDLTPLVCVRCATALPARPDETAWVCGVCGQGQLLETSGLAAMEVYYSADIPPNAAGNAFWVCDAEVRIERQTYKGNSAAEAAEFWANPRRFYIPAFDCPLDALIETGIRLLRQPPNPQPGPRAAFAPVTLAAQDIRAIAEFIVVAVEADRKDKLKELRFTLACSPPQLWVLP